MVFVLTLSRNPITIYGHYIIIVSVLLLVTIWIRNWFYNRSFNNYILLYSIRLHIINKINTHKLHNTIFMGTKLIHYNYIRTGVSRVRKTFQWLGWVFLVFHNYGICISMHTYIICNSIINIEIGNELNQRLK